MARPPDTMPLQETLGLYTLRVWWHAGQWRAALREVGHEEAQQFTEPAQLAAWLLTCGPEATGEDAAPPSAAGPPSGDTARRG